MRLRISSLGPLALLTLTLGVTGCARVESGFSDATGRLSGTYDRFGPNWGGMRPTVPTDSLTVQRIRGDGQVLEPLRTEPGDVWPREEGPRATLANPEEALRGVRAPESDPRRTRGTSGGFQAPPGVAPAVVSPIFESPTPPPAANRTDGNSGAGQVFQSQQGPVTTTGGTGRVRGTISPQGTGTAIDNGPTTTLIGPGGVVEQVPNRR